MKLCSNFFKAVCVVAIFGCSSENKKSAVPTQTIALTATSLGGDTSFLDDKNYVYHNLETTEHLQFKGRKLPGENRDTNMYIDATYTRHYVELTTNQKARLIQKFFSKLMKVDSSYAVKMVEAYFVSKQNRIGDLQPLIIKIVGDDYGSLTVIILDKNHKYVSGYNVSGGFNSGPDEKGDSLEMYETRSYSRFKNNTINTCYIYETDPMDTVKATAAIDSNVFESTIGTDGMISTKQVAKAHYIIPYLDNIKRKKQH